jgi:hypothetical protein
MRGLSCKIARRIIQIISSQEVVDTRCLLRNIKSMLQSESQASDREFRMSSQKDTYSPINVLSWKLGYGYIGEAQ